MEKKTESAKVVRWTKSSFKWLSPVGMFKAVYDKESSENTAILSTSNEKYIKSRAIIGMGTSIFGFFVACFGIYQTLPESPTAKASSFTLMLLVVALFCVLRAFSKYKLMKSIQPKPKAENNEDSDTTFVMDEIAASILLFRITVFKYTYMMAAVFALAMLLTPRNVFGIKEYISKGTLNLFDANITVLTTILLSGIFIVKFVTAKKDISFVMKYKAAPELHGFVTINNSVYELIKIIALLLAIAYIGNRLIELSATTFTTIAAGLTPIIIMGLMCFFSFTSFRSAVCLSGLQTDNSKNQMNAINLLLLKRIMLPKPNVREKVMSIPNINIMIAISFGAALFVGNNTGVTSIIVLIPVVIFQGILLTIDEFHEELKGNFNE